MDRVGEAGNPKQNIKMRAGDKIQLACSLLRPEAEKPEGDLVFESRKSRNREVPPELGGGLRLSHHLTVSLGRK